MVNQHVKYPVDEGSAVGRFGKMLRTTHGRKRRWRMRGGIASSEIIDRRVEAPRYESSSRPPRKLTNEIVDRVKACLDENRKKRSRGQHKQQMKKIDIHEVLVQAGYDIGSRRICHLVTA